MRLSILLVLFFSSNSFLFTQVIIEDRLSGIISGKKITHQFSEKDTIPKVFYPGKNSYNTVLISVDGKLVGSNFSGLIQEDYIESMSVKKEVMNFQGREFEGLVTIASKQDYTPKIVNIEDFIADYADLNADQYICSIDNDVVYDKLQFVYVDEKYIMKVEVKKMIHLEGSTDMFYISLITRSAENLKNANTIMIRGSLLEGL